jgi:Spy/CpxP family protein refolding chaperone
LAALVGVAIVLAAAHPAWAQRGRGFRRMFGVSKAQLASLPEVQDELKMTDEQKTRVAEINDELGENNREASANVDKDLDAKQRKRLQEISIQQNGPRALNDPDVVAELGLLDEQKVKLTAAGEENSQSFEKAFAESGRDDWRQKAGELADEADKRLLSVLTKDQQAKFKQMEGKEFEVDLSQLFRGGLGGR